MYEYIKGTLSHATPLYAVVEAHGIGYKLLLPLSHYAKLPPLGSSVHLFLSCVIREDSHTLYGFLNRGERELFEKFTEISGIGPKTSLALIGHLPSDDLQRAIACGNVALLCKIPGIGKKTAERLVMEMRDKCKNFLEKTSLSPEIAGGSGPVSDAISALVHLGYNAAQAQKAVSSVLKDCGKEPELPQLITLALRSI